MKAIINFKDGKIAIVNDLKHINKISSSNSSVTKIDKFDEFVIHHQPFIFVGNNSSVSVNGTDVHFVTFEV